MPRWPPDVGTGGGPLSDAQVEELYSEPEVQCIMGNGHIGHPPPSGQNDGHYLPATSLVGGNNYVFHVLMILCFCWQVRSTPIACEGNPGLNMNVCCLRSQFSHTQQLSYI